MRDLTCRPEEITSLVRKGIETTGLPPTRAEIAPRRGFSSPHADSLLPVRRLPANPDFEPIVVALTRHERVIEGIAVGVIRNATS